MRFSTKFITSWGTGSWSPFIRSFEYALSARGLNVRHKIEIPVWFRGHNVGDFEADVLVEEKVLLELKAVRALDAAHEAQLLNYLRATDVEVGMLFNFGLNHNLEDSLLTTPASGRVKVQGCSKHFWKMNRSYFAVKRLSDPRVPRKSAAK